MAEPDPLFKLFNEVGIVNQLASALLEARLPKGLLAPHFAVVLHLSRGREGTTPQAMARAFQVPKTTMSHMLSVLGRHDLVEMRPHPKDGRAKAVHLTEAGRALAGRTQAALGPDLARIGAAFDEGWVRETAGRLERLRVWLDADRDR